VLTVTHQAGLKLKSSSIMQQMCFIKLQWVSCY